MPARELERLGRPGELRLAVEPAEHPADRRLAALVDRAGDQQPVDRTRHRDVVETQPLVALGRLPGAPHLLVAEHRPPLTRARVDDLEAEPTVRERQDLVGRRRAAEVTARVGDDDDLELEPLRRVDGQEPHRVGSLLLRHGLELRRAERLLVVDEADEALDVAPARLLVAARQPHQLAQVGVAARPVPAGEDGQVVVVLRDGELAQPLEREPGGGRDEPLVALLESTDEPLVLGRERLRQRALDPGEERPAAGLPPDQHERVVRDADERRREHGDERLVVVAVAQQPQVHEQVDDLLLAEVAPSRRPEGRQPERAQLLLVPLGVRAGGEQQDDLPGRRRAVVDELADPPGDVPRLRPPPVLARLAVGALVGDEQLDRMPEHRVRELPGCRRAADRRRRTRRRRGS